MFPSPASVGPYASSLSVFNGIDPNGSWSLFVLDDSAQYSGAINNGWSLSFYTLTPVCCEGPPSLTISRSGPSVLVNWPTSAAGYVLESTNALNSSLSWPGVTNAVTNLNGTNGVSIIATNGARFFRLRK